MQHTNIQLIKTRDVETKLSLSRVSIWSQVKKGLLPKPIMMGKNAAWNVWELDQILIFRLADRSRDEQKSLVEYIHTERDKAATVCLETIR